MEYFTMTKFELAKRLTSLYSGFLLADFQGETEGVMVHDKISTWYFDPCTNWNDIMPIAIDLGVNIQHIKNGNIYINKPDVMGMSFRLGGGFEMSPQQAIVVCCIETLISGRELI